MKCFCFYVYFHIFFLIFKLQNKWITNHKWWNIIKHYFDKLYTTFRSFVYHCCISSPLSYVFNKTFISFQYQWSYYIMYTGVCIYICKIWWKRKLFFILFITSTSLENVWNLLRNFYKKTNLLINIIGIFINVFLPGWNSKRTHILIFV